MTIYKKIQKARTMLQGRALHKSGKNKFAGYSYFELGDFLPAVNEIFDQVGLCDVITFTSDTASLNIFDTDSGEQVLFSSPMAMANLKGCHDVQNLGASQTYLRRYLWTTAMGIVEHDAVDASKQDVESHESIVGAAVERNSDSLNYIRLKLSDGTTAGVQYAIEAWQEIPEEEQRILWVAPSKCKTAFLTTEERKQLKGL